MMPGSFDRPLCPGERERQREREALAVNLRLVQVGPNQDATTVLWLGFVELVLFTTLLETSGEALT